MGPIEILWGAIALMFIVIAVARGYNKELGATILMLVALLLLNLLDSRLRLNERLPRLLETYLFRKPEQEEVVRLCSMLVYQAAFVAITYAGYAGRVLEWEGTTAGGKVKTTLSLLVGAINGWLVSGTLWYYLDRYDYPLPEQIIRLPLTPLAQELVKFLPPAVLTTNALVLIIAVMLVLRVRK